MCELNDAKAEALVRLLNNLAILNQPTVGHKPQRQEIGPAEAAKHILGMAALRNEPVMVQCAVMLIEAVELLRQGTELVWNYAPPQASDKWLARAAKLTGDKP